MNKKNLTHSFENSEVNHPVEWTLTEDQVAVFEAYNIRVTCKKKVINSNSNYE